MHIYFDPVTIDHFAASNFNRSPNVIALHDSLGTTDRLSEALATTLIAQLSRGEFHQAYVDDLIH